MEDQAHSEIVADALASRVPLPMPLGMEQGYRGGGTSPAVGSVELAYYRAAVAEYKIRGSRLQHMWTHSLIPACKIYRKLPPMTRVVARTAEDAKGICLGITAGSGRIPYSRAIPSGAAELVLAVKSLLAETDPEFTFTSLQLVANERAKLHTDRGNVGMSKTVSLGPFCGGELCIHDATSGLYRTSNAGVVETFSGQNGQLVLPFSSERMSLLAFTHESVFTAGARHMIDQLTKSGFPLPPDAGKARMTSVPKAVHMDEEETAWATYTIVCEDAMHVTTGTSVGAAKRRLMGGPTLTTWTSLATLLVVCIFTSAVQGERIVTDVAWNARLAGGGVYRRTGTAFPQAGRCSGAESRASACYRVCPNTCTPAQKPQ